MLIYPLGLFAIAALVGAYMAVRVFKGAMPPWPAAVLHGLLAASGIVLVVYLAFGTGSRQAPIVAIAAAILVLAALGGFALLSYHLRKQALPRALIAAHALLAVAGFLTLAGATYASIWP